MSDLIYIGLTLLLLLLSFGFIRLCARILEDRR
jgi:hypothetical protein